MKSAKTKTPHTGHAPRNEAKPVIATPVTPTTKNGAAHVSEEEIRVLAYHKWVSAGRPEGDGADFWRQAEIELRG